MANVLKTAAGALGVLAAVWSQSAFAQTANTPPSTFAICSACHSTQAGQMRFGPSLAGVAGRKAGHLPGYTYSTALAASGITWNAATLDTWLTSPQKMVPGTKMPFTGIADPAQRKAVVDYLLTLR